MAQSPLAVSLRFAEFDRLSNMRGWTTDAERARQLNISHATLSNLRSGRVRPGPRVIHAVITAFGAPLYDVLFEQRERRAS